MARISEPLRTRSTTTTRRQSQNSDIGQWTTRQSTTTSVAVGQTDIYLAKCQRLENYYSSTFVPNPTTSHIAYLAHGSPEEQQVNYLKGRTKGKGEAKGKGGKGKKGGDHYKGKGKSKGKGKQGDYNKGRGKGYNEGGKGRYQGWNSWSQGGHNNNKGQGRRKRNRRKGKCYYVVSYLQEVWSRSSELLVQGLYLHYSSSWFRYYWSDTTLQHGSPRQ